MNQSVWRKLLGSVILSLCIVWLLLVGFATPVSASSIQQTIFTIPAFSHSKTTDTHRNFLRCDYDNSSGKMICYDTEATEATRLTTIPTISGAKVLGAFCKQTDNIYHCDTHYENNTIQRCDLFWDRVGQKWITLNCRLVK
jgi:hypothetical protein